ncbi:Nuclear RNA export factor 1 [Melipona quadrifasciata]|uniref:Nuclear RNA export factor 1 n=1 Tax=Melipona quadrifasciata TaxID=166423 RepID=A0A0M8ZMQ7_9HYME|nr:Nuclear RNA export factor 1 [Melipona quadrifasciata]
MLDVTSCEDQLSQSDYYKIIISDGHKYTKDYIINSLVEYVAPETLVPIKYRANGNGVNFFVDDRKVAAALILREITTPRGRKLTVQVTRPPFPRAVIDDEYRKRMKKAIMRRYVPATKSMDLSKFHRDFDLASDYFCVLQCPLILQHVFNVLHEYMPDLEALNLNGNMLNIGLTLLLARAKLRKLKILHIRDISIRNMEEIDAIQGMQLEELVLAGNPVCKVYESTDDYIKEVQKRCPKLLRLDGMCLQKPTLCSVVNQRNNVPASGASEQASEQFVTQFLQEYFLIFDSENRERLLNLYAKDACFSMTPFDPHKPIEDREKLLEHGRWPIVSFFYKMPRTSHYLDRLTIDISQTTEGMTLAAVAGVFKEFNEIEKPVRYFNRTFTIILEGSGCLIKSEELIISELPETELMDMDTEVETSDSEAGETDSEEDL